MGGLFLGGSLLDDHPLGVVPSTGPAVVPTMPWKTPAYRRAAMKMSNLGGSVECASCHDPHETWLVTVQSEYQDDTCLSCHDDEYDYTAHGIANCGSCHRVHAAQDPHSFTREPNPDFLCGACHRGAPTPLMPGIDPIPGAPLHPEPANPRCAECHQIHPGTTGG